MRLLIVVSSFIIFSTDAAASCYPPSVPYQGAPNWQVQQYYNNLEDYQNCQQRELPERVNLIWTVSLKVNLHLIGNPQHAVLGSSLYQRHRPQDLLH